MKKFFILALAPFLAQGADVTHKSIPTDELTDQLQASGAILITAETAPLIKRLLTKGAELLAIPEPKAYFVQNLKFSGLALSLRGIILFNQTLMNEYSYAEKKHTVFHEMVHILQKGKTIEPSKYRHGKEQEADARAILMCGCRACAHVVANAVKFRAAGPNELDYLRPSEFAALEKQIPSGALCPYHRAITKRFSFTIPSWAHCAISKICLENELNLARIIKIKRAKKGAVRIASLIWTISKSIPGFINDGIFRYIICSIGRDVEEKIAKGELDV